MRLRPDSHLCDGEMAPDFEVLDADRRPFRLSKELRYGPILLVFYPADFGVVCSIEMRMFMEVREEIEKLGYRVVWINTDSIESHLKWRSKTGSPFRMLSDSGGSVSKLYGVFIDEEGILKNFSNRSIFAIQTDGCIKYKWVAGQPAVSPDLNEVLASIA
jgi:peroxiredoxin